jgi:murein hydrolase activator
MKLRIVHITLILLFVPYSAVNGQSSYDYLRAQLLERQQNTRSQIENIDRQIDAISNRLSETTQEYEALYRQYEELTRLISLQQERLRQMNREQQVITEEIQLIERNLAELERNLQRLIDEYKATLTYLYKHGRTTELALILTSTSLNQLMIRSYYLSRFNDHVQGQVDEIEETQRQLENSRQDLEQTRERNQTILAEIRQETATLQQQEEQQRSVVDALQSDISNLESQVQRQKEQRENLESAMESLIRDEERLRRAESETGGEVVVRREQNLSDTELNAFESRFRSQRGQLPWPVENGTITQRFGVRVNPVHNTRIPNPGVDISALPGSTVRVVSDGYVFGVQSLQGYGEVVFVNHGNYRTAYGNLSDIYVRRNQVLQQGDVIGLSGDQNSIRGSILFFLIRDGNQMVDPEQWLQNPRP